MFSVNDGFIEGFIEGFIILADQFTKSHSQGPGWEHGVVQNVRRVRFTLKFQTSAFSRCNASHGTSGNTSPHDAGTQQ